MVDADKIKVIKDGMFFAVISYISFLCIVSLILKKDNEFTVYHAKHGLVFFILEVASFIISIIPFLGWLMGFFGFVIFTLLSLWGILQALTGKYYRLPVLSEIAEKIII